MSKQEHLMVVSVGSAPAAGNDDVRLRLKPGIPRTGFVDGGWWPRSRDLVAELPGLAEALRASVGRVERVAFLPSMWDALPARTRGWVGGRRVGLDGFASFTPNTRWVVTSTSGLTPLFLLVVPPDTPSARAAEMLRRAADAENVDEPDDLLGEARVAAEPTAPPVPSGSPAA